MVISWGDMCILLPGYYVERFRLCTEYFQIILHWFKCEYELLKFTYWFYPVMYAIFRVDHRLHFVKGEGWETAVFSKYLECSTCWVCSDCHILVEVCIRLLKIMNNIWPTTMQLIFEWVQRRLCLLGETRAMRKNLSGNDARDWIGQSTLVFLLISIIFKW